MRTVRDDSGNRYLLVKQSSESSRVRDPETGEELYLPNDDIEILADTSALETAASAVPESTRTVLSTVHDDRTLGLLLELDAEPRDVHTLLSAYDLCESDLHGLLGELRAAGLLEETTIGGVRGYRTTDTATEGLDALR